MTIEDVERVVEVVCGPEDDAREPAETAETGRGLWDEAGEGGFTMKVSKGKEEKVGE